MPPQKVSVRPESILRWLPAIILPLMVGVLQPQRGIAALPLLFIAIALGISVAGAVSQVRLAAALSMLLGCFLLSAANLASLQTQGPEGHSAQAHQAHAGLHLLQKAHRAQLVPASLPSVVSKVSEPEERTTAPPVWPASLETISVVLPCAFEGQFAEKTVNSILQQTSHSRLREIIVVDDGSTPPLSEEIPNMFSPHKLRGGGPPVVLIRNEKTRGLIGAKYQGGNAAKGDVVVFLDCHVKPRLGWEEPLLKQMKRAGDHKTVVVPVITSLDVNNWEEVGGDSGAKAMYLMINADFTWLGQPGRDVPMMSGGLLGISRQWWWETGGLDDQMVAWGGENIDQSLRAWLCGGRIEVAEGSFVAHMWRDANNPATRLKYPIPTEQVMRNKARAVTAWFDEFRQKTFRFPEFENFAANIKNVGDMSGFDKLKDRLKCAPFASYIQRFSYVYIDGGLIPSSVYQLKEESSGQCLERVQRRNAPHGVTMAPCNTGEERGAASELQLWHGSSRNRQKPNGPCCSGISAYNLVQCLNAWSVGQKVETFECDIGGYNAAQFMKLATDGSEQLQFKDGEGCLAARRLPEPVEDSGKCGLHVEPVGTRTVDGMSGIPASFRLHTIASSAASTLCLTAGGQESSTLQLQDCQQGAMAQTFTARAHPSGGGLQIQNLAQSCLDAAGGDQMLFYPCDTVGDNSNQLWQILDGSLVWPDKANMGVRAGCLDPVPQLHLKAMKAAQRHPTFMTCVAKKGQRLQRHAETGDGTFLLRDADSGDCLGASAPGSGALGIVPCETKQRWRELKEREQVQHVHSEWCLDAGDEVTPIAYPCHEPKAQRKQRFELVAGWVRTKPGWEDNGRVRFFERCLDYAPKSSPEIFVEDCSQTKAQGIRWSQVNVHDPEELTLWKRAIKPLPGAPVLGGSAEPP